MYYWCAASSFFVNELCIKPISGAIFGTGTNAAYIEDLANIKKLAGTPPAAMGGQMIVNTEWGAFDNTVSFRNFTTFSYAIMFTTQKTILPRTPYDNKLDRESSNPNLQIFEKLISAMYIGEIARNIITFLIDHSPPLLFDGFSPPMLNVQYGFDAEYMSDIEAAHSLDGVKQVLVDRLDFPFQAVSDQDAEIVKWVCIQVATRAAKLSACAIAAILVHCGYAQLGSGLSPPKDETKVVVGVEGKCVILLYVCVYPVHPHFCPSLVRFYTDFYPRLRKHLGTIIGSEIEKRLDIRMPRDPSMVGGMTVVVHFTSSSLTWRYSNSRRVCVGGIKEMRSC